MGLRKRQVEERRDRILQTARKMIAEQGVSQLTMRTLAEQAGLSVPTLYNHFQNKNDILEALANHGVDRIQADFAVAPGGDPLERAGRMVEVAVNLQTSDPDYYRAMILARSETSEARQSPDARVRAMGLENFRQALSADLISDSLDPDLVASHVLSGYFAAARDWALGAITARTFKARALYCVYMPMLASAKGRARTRIEKLLHGLEDELRAEAEAAGPD